MILPPADHEGNPVRVLIVEDHPILALALRELLATDDRVIVVDVVSTGAEACNHAALDDVDVVLSDVHLPDSDGIQVMQALRRTNPHLRVLVMSGSGDDTTGATALASGADAYLEKGEMHTSLVDTIVASVRGRTPARR